MEYNFCGNSGLQLPKISLGLWHNFGDTDRFDEATRMICTAFDNGITHFDLANNYGPPPGSAEINFGKIFAAQLKAHRDEILVASKAGYRMWNGPYGDGSSRKNLMASLDQSLRRTGLDYFDIFYSHRYDGVTPVEETMQALIDMVRQGKALYVGISNYPREKARQACQYLENQNVRCLLYQGKYNLFERSPEQETFPLNREKGVGYIAFSPLAQGLLTNRYLHGIPAGSRVRKGSGFLLEEHLTPAVLEKVRRLNELAEKRSQSLAEMSLAWVLNNPNVTSVIVGTSSVPQLRDNLKALENTHFTPAELQQINEILSP
ncbi:MAG: aldo/keto reductase [Dysgonamonadaceae bacterium]|jgi:L-glyceraldehyde 3-phosphate reductase|nr:aldo/keto reductase [Dysgonamonadaceae bacterium]